MLTIRTLLDYILENLNFEMIIEEDIEKTHKIIVVGNGRIGKSTMITRFAKGVFLEDYKKTLGVAFLEKNEFVSSIGKHWLS